MTLKEKLLKRLPKKYHERVRDLEVEDNLVDDCKYMLYWNEPFTDDGPNGIGSSYPVRSITEAINYIKNSLYEYKEENE